MWWLSRPNLFSKPKPIAAIELEADCRVRAAKLAATSRVPSTAQGWVDKSHIEATSPGLNGIIRHAGLFDSVPNKKAPPW